MKRIKIKPKILFILHYPPPVHGAAMVGQYIRESTLVNKTFDCKFLNLGTSTSVNEIGRNSFAKWRRYFALLFKTVIIILRLRPKLVYLSLSSHGGGFYKDSFVAIIAKVLGCKLVYHFHNKGVSLKQENKLDNILYKIVFKKTNVILLSEALYSDVQKYVKRDRTHICPNGIPERENMSHSIVKKSTNPIELLFLSNLHESKGIFVLLNACKILRSKGINFHCTIIGGEGDINSENLQKRLNDLELETFISYEGKKFEKEKEKYLSQADIFVHPTLNDCFPLVLLEAMQFSLPIVSTIEGGIPGIVENRSNGLLVNKNSAEELASGVEKLISSPELRSQYGKKGRDKYEREFTLNAFENRFKDTIINISNT